jgi:hypothetical protein
MMATSLFPKIALEPAKGSGDYLSGLARGFQRLPLRAREGVPATTSPSFTTGRDTGVPTTPPRTAARLGNSWCPASSIVPDCERRVF